MREFSFHCKWEEDGKRMAMQASMLARDWRDAKDQLAQKLRGVAGTKEGRPVAIYEICPVFGNRIGKSHENWFIKGDN